MTYHCISKIFDKQKETKSNKTDFVFPILLRNVGLTAVDFSYQSNYSEIKYLHAIYFRFANKMQDATQVKYAIIDTQSIYLLNR